MGQLFDTVRQLVADDKYVVGQHASERLEERDIMEWQVVAGLADGELIVERLDAKVEWRFESPYPTVSNSRPFGHIFVKVVPPS